MALEIKVPGPSKIRIGAGTGSLSDFAYTDNEDLARIEVEDHFRVVKTSDRGEMDAAVIYTGTSALIAFTAAKWDEGVWISQMNTLRGSVTEGTILAAKIGQTLFTGASGETDLSFALAIVPAIAGNKSYTFPRCYPPQPHQLIGFGNVEKRLATVIRAVPDNDGVLYSVATV